MQNTFKGSHKDIVYYSANPKISLYMLNREFKTNPFHKLFQIWKYEWDNQLKTVLPSSVNKIVIENIENFQDKRKIIHYLQPHYPFLTISHKVKTSGANHMIDDNLHSISLLKKELIFGDTGIIWELLRKKQIDKNMVRKAYQDNIKIVLKSIKELLPYLDGKIIITSDHGNLFGEYFLYAHPYGMRIRKLIEVPWLEVDNENRY